ncbi:MAG: CdiI family contact-dependent growth inhibition immunity protein [Holosporales bacterium]|jgi:uncharacterized protein (DUF1810 family)|nr:CdiI family contact-dependent growth inhibition immunity protein [Holosporales bacterium]
MGKNIRKRASVQCNGDFISLKGEQWWSILYSTTSIKEISIFTENNLVGKSLIECLDKSKELTNEEWDKMFGTDYQGYLNTSDPKMSAHNAALIQKYNYSDRNALYKNMMDCPIEIKNDLMTIDIYNHTKLDIWEGSGDSIQISASAPPEIIGAAVRYAFSRCRGKGPYAKGAEIVTKALFPNGAPDSLEKYLESVDKDYKKWLIAG